MRPNSAIIGFKTGSLSYHIKPANDAWRKYLALNQPCFEPVLPTIFGPTRNKPVVIL